MNLFDLIFPKNCLECGKSGRYICEKCLGKVSPGKLTCPECKKYSYGGKIHTFCAQKLSLSGMYSFYQYEGVIRKAILAFKYRFAYSIAGELVNALDIDKFNLKKEILLIPVPLHATREKWRGFNQAAILGKLLAEKAGWGFAENLVSRQTNTTPQVKLGKEKRLQNIRGKFAVNREKLSLHKDKTVIIFDDVWTTGATINEIGKELKKNGASEVWGMSVARS